MGASLATSGDGDGLAAEAVAQLMEEAKRWERSVAVVQTDTGPIVLIGELHDQQDNAHLRDIQALLVKLCTVGVDLFVEGAMGAVVPHELFAGGDSTLARLRGDIVTGQGRSTCDKVRLYAVDTRPNEKIVWKASEDLDILLVNQSVDMFKRPRPDGAEIPTMPRLHKGLDLFGWYVDGVFNRASPVLHNFRRAIVLGLMQASRLKLAEETFVMARKLFKYLMSSMKAIFFNDGASSQQDVPVFVFWVIFMFDAFIMDINCVMHLCLQREHHTSLQVVYAAQVHTRTQRRLLRRFGGFKIVGTHSGARDEHMIAFNVLDYEAGVARAALTSDGKATERTYPRLNILKCGLEMGLLSFSGKVLEKTRFHNIAIGQYLQRMSPPEL